MHNNRLEGSSVWGCWEDLGALQNPFVRNLASEQERESEKKDRRS